MWRAGDATKPEYIRFCNHIHLLDLQANKGDKDREEARKAKQDLMAELVGAKQQIELKTNHSNEKGSRLGDGKPLPRSPQSRRHKLGGHPDW